MGDPRSRAIRFPRSFAAGADGEFAPESVLATVRVARFTVAEPVRVRLGDVPILLPVGSFFDVPARARDGVVQVQDQTLPCRVESRVWLISDDGHEVAWARIPAPA